MLKKIFLNLESYLNKIYNRKLEKSLLELEKIDPSFSINFVDVGAAEDIHPRWKRVLKYINYFGFEPDKRSSELLQKNDSCKSYNIFPIALWEKTQKLDINLTKEPRVSSSYQPNYDFLNKFKDSERFKIIKTLEVESVDLDSLEILDIDFIKIDVQGGELDILNGSRNSLERCLGLELEVEFLTLYKGQPLFGDLQKQLINYGFEFIDFVNLCRWERDNFNGFGQCVFGDAFFLKSPEFVIKLGKKKLLSRYLSILLLYRRFDLIDRFFSLLDNKINKEFEFFKKSLKHHRKRFNYLKLCSRIFNGLVRLNSSDNKIFTHY